MKPPTHDDVLAILDNLNGTPWTQTERNAVRQRLQAATPVMLSQLVNGFRALTTKPTPEAAIRTIAGITREAVNEPLTQQTTVDRLVRRIEATFRVAHRAWSDAVAAEIQRILQNHPEIWTAVETACDAAVAREEPLGPAALQSLIDAMSPTPARHAERYPTQQELIQFFRDGYELGKWNVPLRSERETLRQQCALRTEAQREAYRLWREAAARTGRPYPAAASLIPYRPELVIQTMRRHLHAETTEQPNLSAQHNDPFADTIDELIDL